MSVDTRIGISGWNYKGWRGVFYPKGLAHRRELEFASGAFNSIEINGSFYSLQLPSSYQRWHAETPAGFFFSVKGPRFITHMKKLREVEAPLANFFASGVLALEEKLGPILWQFPPNFGWNPQRFRDFFALLPKTTKEAAALGRRHDAKLKTRAFLPTERDRPLRYCDEIRHATFLVGEFFDLLREFSIAFVFADTAGKWPYAEDLTSDFVYCRLHGDTQLYASGYSPGALDWWARRLSLWRQGRQPKDAKLIAAKEASGSRDVFAYFDNDAKVHAPFDAQQLAQRLDLVVTG
ncbi:MAG: DUF72 domain-containing protein [Verrucomicrobiota bacterium]|nr:DUF72 domain-containing protein [Verrucomicrobiota bacterium]